MWPPKAVALGLGGFLLGGMVEFLILRFGVFSATESVTSGVLAVLLPIEIALGVVGGLLLLGGALCLVMALADLRASTQVTGQVVRLRVRGGENHRRYFAGVDDGRSPKVLAWVVAPSVYATLRQGQTVRADVTRFLGFVRSLDQSSLDPAEAEPASPGA
jgi:hypothetical protein